MPAVVEHSAPFSAFVAIRDVLQGVGLRADAALFGQRTQPGPLAHRGFRLNFGSFRLGLGERQKPGDGLNGVDTVTIHLSHDYVARLGISYDDSFELACTDTIAAVHALLSSARTRGMIRMNDSTGVRRVVDGRIETDLTIAVHWSTTLPPAEQA